MHGLFILICIFSDYFSMVLASALGLELSLLLRIVCTFVFVYSVCLAFSTVNDFASNRTLNIFWLSLFVVLSILLSMYITYVIHDPPHPLHSGMILSFGSKVIAATLIALSWNKRNFIKDVLLWIVPFVCLFTIFLLIAAIKIRNTSYSEIVFNYQSLSYAAVYSIGLLFFFIKNYKKCRWLKSLLLLLVGTNLFVLFTGGGKGAFVLFCILFFLFFYDVFKGKSFFLVGAVAFFIFLGKQIVVNFIAQFTGGNRILVLFFSDDVGEITSGRYSLYIKAINILLDRCFLGRGPGSVLYDVGYFCHNIFLDILIDWGFMFLFFFLIVIFVVLRKCFINAQKASMSFLLLVFLGQFIMSLFSGSFYYSFGLWFSIIAVLMYEKK